MYTNYFHFHAQHQQVQWAVVRCCKCLPWVISLGACIRFLYGSCYFLCILYFDLREHLLVCHSNSSPNESCGWLQLRDSIQFAQNSVELDFNPKQLVCKSPKPYVRVIPLFPCIMKVYRRKWGESSINGVNLILPSELKYFTNLN